MELFDGAVLLLDEATAAIDSASEAAFRAALRSFIARSAGTERRGAVVTVAHRLSTARAAALLPSYHLKRRDGSGADAT